MPNSIHTKRHKALAEALAKKRRNSGLTQTEVAKAMGGNWTQPIMVALERGGRRVDLIELMRLANIIGFDVHALVDELREIPDE
jgi:transcriptional regulator with XRE-family HTH domain